MAFVDDIANIGNGYSKTLSSINNISHTAAGTAQKISSIVGATYSSPSEIRDLINNGFLQGNSKFSPRFFARAFDEPTYLTFRLEFIFGDDPEMAEYNLAYNNNGLIDNTMMTSLYGQMYDKMPEPFLQDPGELSGSGNHPVKRAEVPADASLSPILRATIEAYNNSTYPIDTSVGSFYSTEYYLDMALGDHGRAALLHSFKDALRDIQENFPYYFKSISGIPSLTKVDPASGMRNAETAIELSCYEGLDLKITQLINQYRKICWDDVYQRWVLPDMMRYFGMRIYVSEIRMFHDWSRKSSFTGATSKLFGKPLDDFSDPDTRNATARNEIKWAKIVNGVRDAVVQGTAISNAFLGTKNCISKALDYTSGTLTTLDEVWNSGVDIFTDFMAANHSINEIMPTICYECHMCEFDLEETMSYIDELHSSNFETKSPEPRIKIKIGKVKEKQSYLLNASAIPYETTGRYKMTPGEFWKAANLNSFNIQSLILPGAEGNLSLRSDPHKLMFMGNMFSDDVFDKQFKKNGGKGGLYERISDYINNLQHNMGDARACMINVRRLGDVTRASGGPDENLIINKILQDEMTYNRDNTDRQIASISAVGQLLNEITTSIGMSRSTATNPDNAALNSLEHHREMLLEKILGAPESKSTRGYTEYELEFGYPKTSPDSSSDATTADSGLATIYKPSDSSWSEAIDNDHELELGYPKVSSGGANKESTLDRVYKPSDSSLSEAIDNDHNLGYGYILPEKDKMSEIYGDGSNIEFMANNLYVPAEDDELYSSEYEPIPSNGIKDNVNGAPESLATNQAQSILDSINAIGKLLNEAAERIYNSKDINEMEVSDSEKAAIANNLFEKFIDKLTLSAATDKNSVLYKLLLNYKGLKAYSEYKSTATTTPIKGFSKLN